MLEAVNRRIDSKRSDLVSLTVDLVRIPTINPPGDAYTPCAEYIARRLKARGFHVQLMRGEETPGDSDRYPRTNVVARLEGKRPGPTIHFNSHIDVVEAGSGWTFDPFGGEIRDGRIYGRGTCDMKGGLAASIIAVEAYIEANSNFDGAIEISGTVDEESGGFGGVAYLASKGLFSKPRVDHVIIPEPLNKDRVCLGHRGVWWAEIETFGTHAHGSMPFLGDCAVRHMGSVVTKMEEDLYPLLASKRTDMPVVPEGAKQSTLNINSVHGGENEGFDGLPSANVPDSCRMIIDRRFLIEEDIATVKSEVIDLLEGLRKDRENFSYAIRDIMEVLPTMTDRDAPVVQAVSDGIRSVMEREPDYVISPGTYDQKHIARIGHLHDCIAYGPGILDLAHMADEFIVIDDMIESAKVMAHATHALLHPLSL
ncbi:acetylornithine deacetylase/succinyl-diaminopimelate desuccinylase family protein [Pseudahrensia aquimaris]|uniref:Acetylornithine deacetylase/succinyl-diaminopimelate desuccinylase family protein n=1 Tax=Pseudahrensia aquimaris TaxID=744461 RepID=A0ABW3FGX8_9HYPH